MTENSYSSAVRDNLCRIEEQIARACLRAGRKREEVTLLAVTKTVDADRINAAIAAGVTHIGENRVQEWLSKRDALHLQGVTTHLIGHLQTNKVKAAVGADLVESVDSLRLAAALDAAAAASGKVLPVLLEVNIGGEESKSGFAVDAATEAALQMAEFPHLALRGMMCIPPISHTEAEKRVYFAQMRKLFLDIREKIVDNSTMNILSMGMSSDFEEAILEGSTQVRIGTALFGMRNYK